MMKHSGKQEKGEVMLEGMIVMVITMFILLWLLGLGFVYYQRYVTTIVTNDAAVKIASTYNNINSDIVMGFVASEDVSKRQLYRGIPTDLQHDINEDRAASYVEYILNKANFAGAVEDVDVELRLVLDSLSRRHVELTTTCTYNTPFGEGLELFGMSGVNTYQVKACADCTDFADYISTVDYGDFLGSGRVLGGMGIVEKASKYIRTVISCFS